MSLLAYNYIFLVVSVQVQDINHDGRQITVREINAISLVNYGSVHTIMKKRCYAKPL